MISITPLYNPITHRYKGVYPAPDGRGWDAIVLRQDKKLERRGRFDTQEEAAIAVAQYYKDIYGNDWATTIKARSSSRLPYKIKITKHYPWMAARHKGPEVVIYHAKADVEGDRKNWVDVTPETAGIPVPSEDMWDIELHGWKTTNAALVAIRMCLAKHTTPCS